MKKVSRRLFFSGALMPGSNFIRSGKIGKIFKN
jgi:hypothetical protein